MQESVNKLIEKAEAGDPGSQFQLGYKYQFGEGVEKNLDSAIFWYEKAAKKDHCDSFINLAGIYLNRIDGKNNLKLGISYLEKAALLGDAHSQIDLGYIYMEGVQVKKDLEKAKKLFLLAGQSGNREGQYYFGLLNLEENFDLAFDWCVQSANQGFGPALFLLGDLYYKGEKVEKDNGKSFAYYERAAQDGHAPAMYNLSIMLANGDGVDTNIDQAKVWIEKAAKKGHSIAQFTLASMYYEGYLFEQDYQKSIDWFKKSSKHDTSAIYMLGKIFNDERYPKKDDKKSFLYFSTAAQKGHPLAQFELATMYKTGEGTDINIESAYLWFEMAKISAKSTTYSEIVQQSDRELASLQQDIPIQRLQEIKRSVKEKTKEIMRIDK